MGKIILGKALLVIIGLLWCWEILKRLSKDIAEFKSGGSSDKISIGAIWAITILIIILISIFSYSTAKTLIYMLK